MINPLDIFRTNTDYGAQRCRSADCTCLVSLPPSRNIESQNRSQQRRSIYFDEGSSTLSTASATRISEFLSNNSGSRNFTVVGYTDGCGSTSYNHSLSLDRAQEVARRIRRDVPGARISIRAMSEISNTHNSRHRKVEIISGAPHTISEIYPSIIADVYLIDASGSMSRNFREWIDAIQRSRPAHSRVYISYSPYCYNGQGVNSITPGGQTEIWYSYWFVLDKMSSGQTLAIISDFNSTIPLTARERSTIERRVQQKRVTVRAFTP
tara:strand:- start:17 stop:814 length:798 start_codon:yes stop_codon:yes gene_type:complete